jgi:Plasmid pRiA4b ORF-3-like protein
MNNVANGRRATSAKSHRHLTVVPDQPTLWDRKELERLADLHRLAVATQAPDEALRLIAGAASSDEALSRLAAAGLMPSAEESVAGLLSWFAPLAEPGCDQLEAEIAGAEFLAEMRRAGPANMNLAEVLTDMIWQLEDYPSTQTLAMMRVLAVVGPAEIRVQAANAAARLAQAGLADMPWAAGLGEPTPGRSFGYRDVYDEQRSLVTTFSYARKKHAVIVLIDYLLGGGIKDCYLADYTESVRQEYRALGRDPELEFTDLSGAEARAILDQALARRPCPVRADQIDNVDAYLDLVRQRTALLPHAKAGPGGRASSGKGAAHAAVGAKRPAAKNIHRLKVTLRGSKPPIWRRFEVPSDITLQRLHAVLQIGFDWEDRHLHVFETPSGRYGLHDPEIDIRSAARKKLSDVADWPGDRFRYDYDFGDGWEHDIVVEAVQPAEPGVAYPRCTAGKRAVPPEDSGGIPGYYRLLDAISHPGDEEHEMYLDWLGIDSADELDPDAFDRDALNAELAPLSRVLIRR